MPRPVPPSAFGRKASPAPSAPSREDSPMIDSAALRRAEASHLFRRGASELAAPDSFDSFRDQPQCPGPRLSASGFASR